MADTGNADQGNTRERGWLVLKHHILTHKVHMHIKPRIIDLYIYANMIQGAQMGSFKKK